MGASQEYHHQSTIFNAPAAEDYQDPRDPPGSQRDWENQSQEKHHLKNKRRKPVEEKKVSSSAEARPTPPPIVLEDEDPDFIDLTKPIKESTIVDLTGGASSAANNDRDQYILDLHAEEEYEEELLRWWSS